jgi:uncharacterized membrane protein
MLMLVLAAGAFVGIHLFISSSRLRDRIVGATGEQAYLGLFSLLSIAVLAWLIFAYSRAPTVPLWNTPGWLRGPAIAVLLVAVALVVIGLTTPSPTVTGGTGALDRDDAVRASARHAPPVSAARCGRRCTRSSMTRRRWCRWRAAGAGAHRAVVDRR